MKSSAIFPKKHFKDRLPMQTTVGFHVMAFTLVFSTFDKEK